MTTIAPAAASAPAPIAGQTCGDRLALALEPLLILPLGDWREIILRSRIGGLTRACLALGIVVAYLCAPPYHLDHTFILNTLPSVSIILLLAVMLFFFSENRLYVIPICLLGINIVYLVSNLAAIFIAERYFRTTAMFVSIIFYFINSIIFSERFAYKLNLAVFVVVAACTFDHWLKTSASLPPQELSAMISAVALSAGCLFTQQLALAVRSQSLQRLANARIRMAEMQAERQIAEERLAAHEHLVRLNRISVLEAMSSSLAHEINQPISAATTYAAAAQRWLDRPVPNVAEALHAVCGVVSEIDSVGQRVLTIRQLSSRQPGEYRPTDLPALVQAQVQLVHGEFERRGIALTVTCSRPEALHAVPASAPDLAQVVMNLLANALEAFPLSPPDAAVRVEVLAPTPRWAEIRVVDNGCGIAAEDLGKVFQPFYTTRAKGTGLGLSICREIAERHTGSLAIESAPGGGTIAILRLAMDR